VLGNVSGAIADFRDWLRSIGEPTESDDIAIAVAAEAESVIEADEDSEVFIEPDREPLLKEAGGNWNGGLWPHEERY
jgi:hypothetical protein